MKKTYLFRLIHHRSHLQKLGGLKYSILQLLSFGNHRIKFFLKSERIKTTDYTNLNTAKFSSWFSIVLSKYAITTKKKSDFKHLKKELEMFVENYLTVGAYKKIINFDDYLVKVSRLSVETKKTFQSSTYMNSFLSLYLLFSCNHILLKINYVSHNTSKEENKKFINFVKDVVAYYNTLMGDYKLEFYENDIETWKKLVEEIYVSFTVLENLTGFVPLSVLPNYIIIHKSHVFGKDYSKYKSYAPNNLNYLNAKAKYVQSLNAQLENLQQHSYFKSISLEEIQWIKHPKFSITKSLHKNSDVYFLKMSQFKKLFNANVDSITRDSHSYLIKHIYSFKYDNYKSWSNNYQHLFKLFEYHFEISMITRFVRDSSNEFRYDERAFEQTKKRLSLEISKKSTGWNLPPSFKSK